MKDKNKIYQKSNSDKIKYPMNTYRYRLFIIFLFTFILFLVSLLLFIVTDLWHLCYKFNRESWHQLRSPHHCLTFTSSTLQYYPTLLFEINNAQYIIQG